MGNCGSVCFVKESKLLWSFILVKHYFLQVGRDRPIWLICVAVFLSYLPEAGQYSCFFVYLRLVVGFSPEDVALFIAVVGLLSVVAQTGILTCFMHTFNAKATIMIGLTLEMIQLMWYGLGSQTW